MKYALLAALTVLSTPAMAADFKMQNGDWTTKIVEQSSDGTPLCVMATEPPSGGLFMIKLLTPAKVIVEVYHKAWTMPEGKNVSLMIGVNGQYVIREAGVSYNPNTPHGLLPGVGVNLTADDVSKLFGGLRSGTPLWVGFANSKAEPWKLSLNGAKEAADAMAMCSNALMAGLGSKPPVMPDTATEFKSGKGGI